MREIKYQAWLKLENKMVDVKQLNFNVQTITHDYIREIGGNSFDKGYPNTNFSDLNLRQYTGLKDKNGKEIYEGDIIATKERDVIFEIKHGWNMEETYGWYLSSVDIPNDKENFVIDKSIGDLEVIGNIYENPELIK